jgi:DNA repair protein RadC
MCRSGSAALSDAELLALILRTGDFAAGLSAIDLGRELISEFRDLRGLSSATVTEICRVKGVGLAKASSIKAALELGSRCGSSSILEAERFSSSVQVFEHYRYRFRDQKKEHVLSLLLDGKNRVIREERVSEGSLNQSIVHPREVFNPAVRESAAAIIIVHNHPTGDPSPSREDLEITRRLKEAGDLLGIRLLDHIIIGDGTFFSFADKSQL